LKEKKNGKWRRLLIREKYGERTNTWCDGRDVQQRRILGKVKRI